jgi:RNA polymerase-binding transcription factor
MIMKLPKGYRPSSEEPFMNDLQQEYFRQKLVVWRDELLVQYKATVERLNAAEYQGGDFMDQASSEVDQAVELRTRGRERKLLAKIDEALERLADGTYGYCSDTGKPIGLKRLEARPTTSRCIEAQEAHERRERMNYRD